MEWFLIKQSEHLGPFSEEALRELFSNGELGEESLIWQEGWQSAETFHNVFLRESDESIQDTLEVVKDSHDVELSTEALTTLVDSNLPPDLPGNSFVNSKVTPKKIVSLNLADTSTSLGQVEESETEKLVKKSSGRFFKVSFFMILIISTSFFSWVYYEQKVNVFSRPKLMTLKDYNRLKKTALSPAKELKFSFSLGKNKKSLWIATNNPLEGEVFIHLKSVKERTLGEKVEVKATGSLSKKLISLKKFQFVTGSRFVDGFYNIEISTMDNLSVPLHQRFFSVNQLQFKFVDQFLITNLLRKDFKRQLVKYIKAKNSNSKLFWEELIQKYQTVKMITGQIREGFSLVFDGENINWMTDISTFENNYKTNFGIFFTEFVKTNESSYAKLTLKEFEDSQEVLANYSHLSKLATEIGQESMQVLEDLQSFDILKSTVDSKETLKLESIEKLNKIISQCENKIKELTEKKSSSI